METLEGEALSRRDVLKIGVGTGAGYAIAASPVLARAIRTDTQGLAVEDVKVQSGRDTIPAYEARPAGAGKYPMIVVISEISGLSEYIKDVCRRFAKEGYYAIAPELFAREGGVAHLQDIQDVLKIVLNIPRKQLLQDLTATADHARRQPWARADRVGVTGFCWGGSTTIQFAALYKDLKAAVVWYGALGRAYQDNPPRSGFDVAQDITCPLLGLFGEEDQSPSPADVRRFEEMLKMRNKNVEIVIYPKAGHAFHADYRPSYRPEAAKDGWTRCLAWFGKYLKG